jgi:hypothetical protein
MPAAHRLGTTSVGKGYEDLEGGNNGGGCGGGKQMNMEVLIGACVMEMG